MWLSELALVVEPKGNVEIAAWQTQLSLLTALLRQPAQAPDHMGPLWDTSVLGLLGRGWVLEPGTKQPQEGRDQSPELGGYTR